MLGHRIAPCSADEQIQRADPSTRITRRRQL